jgi:protein gp37
MKGLTSSRIPYIHDCNGKRWNPIEGCSNTGDICAVRKMGLCWAENMAGASCPNAKIARSNGDEFNWCEEESCDHWNEQSCTKGFKPIFHPEFLTAPLHTRKNYVIFTGFGGDMWSDKVDTSWRNSIFYVESKCPQHIFVHLTKNPVNVGEHENGIHQVPNQENIWMGVSVLQSSELWKIDRLHEELVYSRKHERRRDDLKVHIWVSFEPVIGDMKPKSPWREGYQLSDMLIDSKIEFVVAGGLSNGDGKVVSSEDGGVRASFIQPILDAAYEANVPVFLKNIDRIWKQIINPRTKKPLQSPYEMRDIPHQWYESEVVGFNP